LLIDQLTQESGRHIAALRLSLRAQQGLGNWQEVLHLVRQLEKHKAMTAEQSAPLRMRAHRENIKALEDDGFALERYLDRIPSKDRRDPRVILEAIQALIRARHCETAARLIEDVLDETWDSGLIAAYGRCDGGDVMGRIARAEVWLESHPRDMQLLLTLGRLCRQLQLWGKAQSYFEASLAIEPSRRTHLELAGLLDHLEKPDEANRHFRSAAVL
jgi:HemY protein